MAQLLSFPAVQVIATCCSTCLSMWLHDGCRGLHGTSEAKQGACSYISLKNMYSETFPN